MFRMREWLLAVFASVLVLGLTPVLGAEEKAARGDQQGENLQGQVQSISAEQHQLVVKDQQGREHTFQIGREAKVRLNGKDGQLADLKQGDRVTLNVVRVARDIRSAQRGQALHAIRGQIKRVDDGQRQLVLKDQDGKERMVQIARDAHIRGENQDRQLADLKEGEEVLVIAEQDGENWTACAVRAQQRGQAPHVAQGQVQNVSADQNRLVLKDQQGKERTFQITRDARVHLAGKEAKIGDLKEGDQVGLIFRVVVREVRSDR